MMEKIRAACVVRSNPEFGKWPDEFVCRPMVGDCVQRMDDVGEFQIVKITHCIAGDNDLFYRKGLLYLLVELG